MPPKAAFNSGRYFGVPIEDAMELLPGEMPSGRVAWHQGGCSLPTLCGACHSYTNPYDVSLVNLCRMGMNILGRSQGHPSLVYIQREYPLRLLKAIVTMFFSINDETFRQRFPELERFVLWRDARGLPEDRYRFFIYYYAGNKLEHIGFSARGDFATGVAVWLSEITFAPFGYVMIAPYAAPDGRLFRTVECRPPDRRLVEITDFARFRYDQKVQCELRLPVLPRDSFMAGDYRTAAEMMAAKERNLESAARRAAGSGSGGAGGS